MKNHGLNNTLARVFLALVLFAHAQIFALNLHENKIKKLSNEVYWHKLLHYDNNESIIDTKEFFLAQNGNESAEAELKATIESFNTNPDTKCRFPARYKWLHSKGAINSIDVECSELESFLEPNFNKISIVYSTERYSEAASLFGHVLLKVDSKTKSNVIEYTADVPPGTSGFSYAYKGLFGGFVSKYNFFSFFAKNYEARNQEFRDLVVYELDFSQDEIDNILLHLYEVIDTKQKYYFLTRNCSSELIELIDMANYDVKNRDRSRLFVVPVEVISEVDKAKKINNIKLLHSKLKQFEYHYQALKDSEQDILKDIIYSKRSVRRLAKDKNIDKNSKDKIVLTALLYFEIGSQNGEANQKTLSKIVALSKYKNENLLNYNHEYKNLDKNPVSQYMYKASLGYLYKKESYATLGFRNLYKNRFDLLDGLVKNGSVELLDFQFRAKGKLSLEYLTLIHLSSMPLSNGFFSEHTKDLSMGLKRLFYSDKLYVYGEYALGKRIKVNENISYALGVQGGVYDSHDTLIGLGLKTELEYKKVSNYLVRGGANLSRYEDDKFKTSLNDFNAFMQFHFRVSKNSLFGSKIEYNDNSDEYITSSLYYNYSF